VERYRGHSQDFGAGSAVINPLACWVVPGFIAISVCLLWSASPWPVAGVQIAGFVLAAIFVIGGRQNRIQVELPRVLLPLSLMALWPGLQLALGTTVYSWKTIQAWLYWANCLAWFFVALQLYGDARRSAWLIRGLAFFSYAIALVAPLQHALAPDRVLFLFPIPRGSVAMGPFLYLNHYSGFVEICLPMALYAAVTDQRFRTVHIAGCALLYTSIIAAASRAGFVVATATVAVTVVLIFARAIVPTRRLVPVLLRSATVAVVLVAAIGPVRLLQKFTASDPYSLRRQYLRSSVAMVRDRPLLGVGLGNWATMYPGYARFDDGAYVAQARNDWAQWAAEGGLPFLGLAVWFAIGLLGSVHRTIWGYGVAAIFLHSWVDYLIERTAMAMLFFVVAGAMAAAKSPPQWE
jgi:hypothetical protein